MELSLDHPNLNLFRHFGDSAENENNTTRAFLIAATRSPWSWILLRGFFDLLVSRTREKNSEGPSSTRFFQSWPDQIEFSLERDISAETFPGMGVRNAILVELTPAGQAPEPEQPEERKNDRGRVDATIVIRQPDGDGLAVVIESKLYGRAGHEQLLRYTAALEKRGILTTMVDVTWEEVYALANALPNEAEHDSVINDFKSFLARDPRLAGFTGFQQSDFSGPPDALDARLHKFVETLIGREDEPILSAATVERKRGGLDYDILLPRQSRLVGNIGLACWEKKAISAKLVIGWRSRWETDRVVSSAYNSEAIHGILKQLGSRGRVSVEAIVRPFFSRFQYPSAASLSHEMQMDSDPVNAWSEAVEFARAFHGKPLDNDFAAQLERRSARVLDQEALNRALVDREKVNCFVPLVVLVTWDPQEVVRIKQEDFTKIVRSTLVNLAQMLAALSGEADLG